MRWREDNPDWKPEKGELMSSEASKSIYLHLCDENPAVAAMVVSCCMNRELKALNVKMPYNHKGKARKRWQALLAHEVSPQTAHPGIVPIHNRTIRLCYVGRMNGPTKGPVGLTLAKFGKSSAVIAFQVFSKSSGRPANVFCRIETRQLPAGKRKILQRIARGEWGIRDSMLVYKEKQQAWFFQLAYKQPMESLGIDRERVAVLKLADKEADQPFILTLGENEPTWNLGFRILPREYQRIQDHRFRLRGRYKVAGSGRRGHGRARIEYRLRNITHQAHDLMERFTDHVVADVLKFCQRHDCGTIDYHEPALAARARTWFGSRNIPYDWTNLQAKLAQKCTRWKIRLRVNGEEKTE